MCYNKLEEYDSDDEKKLSLCWGKKIEKVKYDGISTVYQQKIKC